MAKTERDYGESRKYVVEILKGFGTMDWESMTMPNTMDLFLVILHMRELMPPYTGR